ncbi:MAG: hypothetical protein WCL08_02705, partial [Verrucomicrobiota bacterium]
MKYRTILTWGIMVSLSSGAVFLGGCKRPTLPSAVKEVEQKEVAVVAPPPVEVLLAGRYRDNGDGTVTDATTSLQWMRCSLGQEW